MTAPEAELRTTWQQIAGGAHEHLLDRVLASHREPHRRYHTSTHVMWVLRHLSRLAAGVTEPIDLAALQMAALHHDIVYDARASDNEARSADLAAVAATELGWDAPRVELVHRLVMATAGHHAADLHEALLVDADLAILGADPKDYEAYVRGIRSEYGHVSDGDWRNGRGAVLRGFLALPQLFNTDTMRAERDARARANMAAELAVLDAR